VKSGREFMVVSIQEQENRDMLPQKDTTRNFPSGNSIEAEIKETKLIIEATCMTVVDMATDKRKDELPSSTTSTSRPDSNGARSCPHACEIVGCLGEGFSQCIGHQGHVRHLHQCHTDRRATSGPSGSEKSLTKPGVVEVSTLTELSRNKMSDKEISRVLIENALLHLRSLHDDAERLS
jgi:hypothetical protein